MAFVGFSSGVGFDYNNSDGVSAGTYDFYGVVLHEISEVLGRATNDGQNNTYYPLDLFHYSAPGVRTFSGTTPGYFSVDNGQTNLNNFSTIPAAILAIGQAIRLTLATRSAHRVWWRHFLPLILQRWMLSVGILLRVQAGRLSPQGSQLIPVLRPPTISPRTQQ